jgi:formyltetrahydrofolate synthetase
MKSDIEIARSIELTKIKQIARETGIPVEHISNYVRKTPNYANACPYWQYLFAELPN